MYCYLCFKVLNVCSVDEDQKRYYVHYKGWNSRYDEWIDKSRIASKSESGEESSPEPSKNEVSFYWFRNVKL